MKTGKHSLVQRYLDIFFSGIDQERLYDVLAVDLQFEGPFLRCHSAREYIDSLIADPCINCRYRMIETRNESSAVTVVYEFVKPGISIDMTQRFEFSDGEDGERISRILLDFDAAAFD